jgi:hypothetical protein
MTREEYEQLQKKFGPDISAWPAPYRTEALILVLNEKGMARLQDDEGLDRAILAAALTSTDEMKLTRTVLKRLDQQQAPHLTLQQFFPVPRAAFASFVAVLMLAAVSGYLTTQPQDDADENEMLALAIGAVDVLDLPDAAEEGL